MDRHESGGGLTNIMGSDDPRSGLLVRRAAIGDYSALRALERRAFLTLGTRFYPREDIECALAMFDGLTPNLIDEGHYFLIETTDRRPIASGGWSQAELNYVGTMPGPLFEGIGIVRCVYVDPDCAGRGFGKRIMTIVELDARTNGIATLTLTSSRTAESLYVRMGFAPGSTTDVPLSNGHSLTLRAMSKTLDRL